MLPLIARQLGLTKNNTRLLHDINLQINQAGISIIMGHNGAGKSLLLRSMHGLIVPTDGSVTWDGDDAVHIESRKKQAMVFQKPLMLNRSVEANINYVLKLRGKPAHLCQEFLESAGLNGKNKQSAKSLSGGEQQRLAIRRLADEIIFLHKGSLTEHTGAGVFFTQPHSVEAQNYLTSYLGSR